MSSSLKESGGRDVAVGDERLREAIPISHPAVRRPDSEDHPRECRLIKDTLPKNDRYVDTSLVLGLMDFVSSLQ